MSNNKLFFVLAILISVNFDIGFGWRNFWKGRHRNGNLGEPSKTPRLDGEREFPDLWFEQNLDHFDPTNNATWKQRYFVNDEYHKTNGPVFLMIGGEGEASPKWMNQGAWIKYAQEHNALCFQIEHRYYGKSHPTDDLSTKNLIYLNSEQALADLAYFIESMHTKYNLSYENKWIAFGGSYPGSLAAWVREKYPHLIYGSISSSGPLLAKIDFREYYEVVINSLSEYNPDCVKAVQSGMSQVETLLKHMIGQKSLDEKFNLCDPVEKSINNPFDIANLFENIASDFAGVVQYNKDYSPHSRHTIDEVCDIMMNQTLGTPVSRLAAVNKLLQNDECLDYKYDKMIEDMRENSWDSKMADGARQWTYQTCTEFGFYQTSDDPKLVFGDRFPVNFFVKMCTDIYGPKFTSQSLERSIYRTNTIYGALHPSTTNVLYIHGSIDPWHALGLIESKNPNMPTIYIKGTAHCANMYEPQDDDFEQLKDARNKINEYIRNLLVN